MILITTQIIQANSRGDNPARIENATSNHDWLLYARAPAATPMGTVMMKYGMVPSGKMEGKRYGNAIAVVESKAERSLLNFRLLLLLCLFISFSFPDRWGTHYANGLHRAELKYVAIARAIAFSPTPLNLPRFYEFLEPAPCRMSKRSILANHSIYHAFGRESREY